MAQEVIPWHNLVEGHSKIHLQTTLEILIVKGYNINQIIVTNQVTRTPTGHLFQQEVSEALIIAEKDGNRDNKG